MIWYRYIYLFNKYKTEYIDNKRPQKYLQVDLIMPLWHGRDLEKSETLANYLTKPRFTLKFPESRAIYFLPYYTCLQNCDYFFPHFQLQPWGSSWEHICWEFSQEQDLSHTQLSSHPCKIPEGVNSSSEESSV